MGVDSTSWERQLGNQARTPVASFTYTDLPTYLTTDIHLVSEYGRRPLRSSTDSDRTRTVPRTHNRFGDRSFAVAGPHLWNSLPISLRQISSFGQFRRYLKNHLFEI